MILFPNCKINLGLNVVARRADGFHDIETVFYPVPLKDALEIMPGSGGKFEFQASGPAIPGEPGENLCVRAYRLLQTDFGLPPVKIHLHKVIPMGSGLGGGSADAAFCLKGLNDLFSIGLDDIKLQHYASMLGSDCPFFIKNKQVLACGRGDQFEDINVNLSGLCIVVVVPGIHVSTSEAYGMLTPHKPLASLKEVVMLPPDQWKDLLVNDFEGPVTALHPVIGDIKTKLYDAGVIYASMSGSGSAVYGLFRALPDMNNQPFKDMPGYFGAIL